MRVVTTILILALAGCAGPPALQHAAPLVLAALGDSITRAFNLEPALPGEHPEHSWATGLDPNDTVESIAERLNLTTDRVYNDARSGARVGDLGGQVDLAIEQKATVVTLLIGMNDICGRGTTTSPEGFRAGVHDALMRLHAGLPDGARVLVLSLPNASRLPSTLANDTRALTLWNLTRACGGALPDHAANLSARIDAFDAILADEAARAGRGVQYDDGAVHDAALARADVSTLDAFHPSITGQARLATIASAFI